MSTQPSQPPPFRIGVVGLGRMGQAFATNLIADGHHVLVHDRNGEKMRLLERAGAHATARLSDLAECDIVMTSLTDDEVVGAVALGPDGLVSCLKPGSIHVSMSTISPGLSRRLSEQHLLHHQGYVAAPVLGNPDLARTRKLFVIAAGPTPDVDIVHPILRKLGERVFVVGEEAASANAIKLAANVLTALTLESMGEVLALLRKSGVDANLAFNLFTASLFDGRVHKTYGRKIVDERYSPPGMTVPLAVKDLRLALAEAERQAVPMPAASLVHDRLVGLIARGWADLDWSALGLLAASDAGLNDNAEALAKRP